MGWQVCMFPCQQYYVSIWGNLFLCLPFAFVSDIPHKRSRGWERIEKIESHLSYSVHQTFVVASQVLTEWMKWEHFESHFSSHSALPTFLWKAMHQLREVDQLGVCSRHVTRAWIFCMTDSWDSFYFLFKNVTFLIIDAPCWHMLFAC